MTAERVAEISGDALVGETILILARRQGVRQKAIAAALGMTQGSVSNKMRGLRPWTLTELQVVASVLGTEVTTLVAGLPRLDSNQQPSGYPLVLVRRMADVVSLAEWRAA